MRKTIGEKVTKISLAGIDGSTFELESLGGKPYLLAFFRFASCPFCNMRIHELVSRFDELGENFTIVAVFDSPLDNLIAHANRHDAPFPILADPDNIYYREYGIEKSFLGVLKGITLRLPTMLKGLLKGYIPLIPRGSMITMPADFLIDKEGIIQEAYYGKDEGDHLPFDAVKAFACK